MCRGEHRKDHKKQSRGHWICVLKKQVVRRGGKEKGTKLRRARTVPSWFQESQDSVVVNAKQRRNEKEKERRRKGTVDFEFSGDAEGGMVIDVFVEV